MSDHLIYKGKINDKMVKLEIDDDHAEQMGAEEFLEVQMRPAVFAR